MTASLSPALVPILGAVLVPFLRGRLRDAWILLLPVIGLGLLLSLPDGDHGSFSYLGLDIVPVRVDDWSRIFGIMFFIGAALSAIYALHVRDWVQQVAGLVYAGAGIGAVLAGDFFTLFVYWELTAIASVFLVWARRTGSAYRAGLRYVLVQLLSGMLLLIGAVVLYGENGSIRFEHIGLQGLGGWLVFLAFGIKCAFPLLHNWLQDAYPEATATGTVYLSVFTTKLAVYALARGYAGTDILVVIGATMAVFPIFYAIIENDLRRVLAYSLNNQLGFMVVGIGIGTELALNGAAAHAFTHILYKSLLFMSMGAVLLRAGTVKVSELGGLFRSMPWTTACCIVGAASICAVPLFSGFVSKSLILTAVAHEGHLYVWLALLFASAAAPHYSGIKIPYFAFFARDRGIRCQEAPRNMLVAMGIAAFLCVAIGLLPGALYALLPYEVNYVPYTAAHVLSQMQLLMFSALAFAVLVWHRVYLPQPPAVNLDTDWLYRRLAPAGVGWIRRLMGLVGDQLQHDLRRLRLGLPRHAAVVFGDHGALTRTRSTSYQVTWVAALLAGGLLLFYLSG